MRMMLAALMLWMPGLIWGQQPGFSLEGGWYDHPQVLHLEAPGSKVYYTLDGSMPRPSGRMYSTPITLHQTTVVRAIACRDGRCSGEQTHTFFIQEPRSRFPTVSVVVNPNALFHPEYGLYREGWKADRSHWKRPGANFWSKKELLAHAEIFDAEERPVFRANTGFRIFGGMSRLSPQKSFTLVARAEYGKKRIDYPVFGAAGPRKFKSLVFRNGGSDWGRTHFRDALMIDLLDGWDIEKQDHQPVHVYLNGQYWGVYNIRDKINRFFIEAQSGEDRDSIDLLEHNAHPKKGSARHYKQLLEYLRIHDMRDDRHFEVVDSMMDTDNFLHYQLAQIYFDNQDAGGNIRFWRPQRPDGRWRWIIYDVDQGFGRHQVTAYTHNTLAFQLEPRGPSWPNPPWSTFVLRRLLENPGFRARFIHRAYELLYTDFEPARVMARIRAFADLYRPEMPRHFTRWGLQADTWEEEVAVMQIFARERPAYLRQFLRAQFDLGPDAQIDFAATAGGVLTIGERVALESDSLAVILPEGTPLAVRVEAHPGYRFTGWEGLAGKDWAHELVMGQAPARIRAVFEPYRHPLAEKVIINEVGANHPQAGDWLELYNQSDVPVDVTSWVLADARHRYRLPTAVIPAGGYLVLCQDLVRFRQYFPGVPAAAGDFRFGLSKREEAIYLYSYDGAYVDSVRYRITPMDTVFTLALLLPELDNARPENWEILPGVGTPGGGNPYYMESRVREIQEYWLRIGLYAGALVCLLLALVWRWQRQRVGRDKYV